MTDLAALLDQLDDIRVQTLVRLDSLDQDQLEGPCEFVRKDGTKVVAVFAGNRLTNFNGTPFVDHLFHLLESNAVDEPAANELSGPTNIHIGRAPLRDFVEFVTMLHRLPVIVDAKTVGSANPSMAAEAHGMNLGTVLTLALAPHGLVCDYRFGRLWITTAEDAEGWRDTTGILHVQPPVGTRLARAWNDPAVAAVTTSPLAEVLTTIAQPLNITLAVASRPRMRCWPAESSASRSVRALPSTATSPLRLVMNATPWAAALHAAHVAIATTMRPKIFIFTLRLHADAVAADVAGAARTVRIPHTLTGLWPFTLWLPSGSK